MQVFSALENIPAAHFAGGTAVAIGKFDGVHLGHQQLLQHAVAFGREQSLTPIVMTFTNNPLSYLRPEQCPAPIMSPQQRLEALAAAGASACVMAPFDANLAQLSAEQFVSDILVAQLGVRALVVGFDFRFGARGLGDVTMLRELSDQYGFTVDVLDDVTDGQIGKISSSRVREAIIAGEVVTAARMMGRYAAVRGVVVHGDARGRELGFPTANVGGDREGLRPADGVYAGWAQVGGQRIAAAISVGANVTFDPLGEPRVEAHLIDYAADIYGQPITIEFVHRIRGMERFDGVEALITQMQNDVREARSALSA